MKKSMKFYIQIGNREITKMFSSNRSAIAYCIETYTEFVLLNENRKRVHIC